MKFWKRRIQQQTDSGLNIVHTGSGNINLASSPNLEFLLEAYKAEAPAILLARILDRETEQAELVRIAESDGYIWYQGLPWAGKSTLMSWFAAKPPASVRVACFFVNSRLPGAADSTAFIRAMIRQLADIANIETGIEFSNEATSGQLAYLLTRAAEEVTRSGKRLVLIVDGLDEDQGQSPSIAYSLPRRLPVGVRVIASSRPYPLLPRDLPGDHPLRECERRILKPSPHATRIRDDAVYEIGQQMAAGRNRDLIGLLVAAGGGLSPRDLAELSESRSKVEITNLLHTGFGRIIDARSRGENKAWMLAHAMLLESARDQLDEELPYHLKRLHQWADKYRREGWPATTPDYLLRSYVQILSKNGNLDRAVIIATDWRRHDRMLALTGTEINALEEIFWLRDELMKARRPDLGSLAKLAFSRSTIGVRNASFPGSLPGLWAELGDPDRGEALARSIAYPEDRGLALVDVAFALAATDLERAAAVCKRAQMTVPSIVRSGDRVGVLVGIAEVLAAADPDRAEEYANSIGDSDSRSMALALTHVADAVVNSDPPRAIELCHRAAEIARPIAADYFQLDALASAVRVLARIDLDRAEKLADDTSPQIHAFLLVELASEIHDLFPERAANLCDKAERAAESVTERYYRDDIISRVSAVLAASDFDKAIGTAESISDVRDQTKALARVAIRAAAHNTREAETLALSLSDHDLRASSLHDFACALALSDPDRAERLAYATDDITQQVSILTEVVSVVGKKSPDRAADICDIAERLARSIGDSGKRASLLTNLASAISAVSLEHAVTLCEEATQDARSDPDFVRFGCIVARVAAALAGREPGRAAALCKIAEHIAGSLIHDSQKDFVLVETATALAAFDSNWSMRVLDSISQGELYDDALPRVIEFIAGIDHRRAIELSGELELPHDDNTFSIERLSITAGIIASIDVKQAEFIANSIPPSCSLARIAMLARTSVAILDRDPNHASEIRKEISDNLASIDDPQHRAIGLSWAAYASVKSDPFQAHSFLETAEQIAMTIDGLPHREMTLAMLVYPISMINAVRAKKICESLTRSDWRTHGLEGICRGLKETAKADSAMAQSLTASILADVDDSYFGGNWTLAFDLLAVISPKVIESVADQLDIEIARYPELAGFLSRPAQ